MLLLSDTFDFSWRYQLPALMTLPPAGALGITVIIGYVRGLRGPRSADGRGPAAGIEASDDRGPERRPDTADPDPQDSDHAPAVDS